MYKMIGVLFIIILSQFGSVKSNQSKFYEKDYRALEVRELDIKKSETLIINVEDSWWDRLSNRNGLFADNTFVEIFVNINEDSDKARIEFEKSLKVKTNWEEFDYRRQAFDLLNNPLILNDIPEGVSLVFKNRDIQFITSTGGKEISLSIKKNLKLNLFIPDGIKIEVHNCSGEINLIDIEENLKVISQKGEIHLKLRDPVDQIIAKSEEGEVKSFYKIDSSKNVTNPKVELRNTTGNIYIEKIQVEKEK